MKTKTVSVSAIKEGTVIDHIEAGRGLQIVRLLSLLIEEKQMTIGLNLKSPSMGLKDLIKIEDRFLTPSDIDQIAIFAPLATVNVIKNYAVAEKFAIVIPERIEKVFICPNLQCITNAEPISTLFFTEEIDQATFLH